MTLGFDLHDVSAVEFGVCLEAPDVESLSLVPVDEDVQATLQHMVEYTWASMQEQGVEMAHVPAYDPSDKHGATEYSQLPVTDELSARLRQIHEADNIDIDSEALKSPNDLAFYFVRLTDSKGRRLTGLRRASQFRGIVKSRVRLVRLLNDTLALIDDDVFKLDRDFDVLIAAGTVHILRPAAFEFLGQLTEAVLAAVSDNVTKIQAQLKFIDFGPVAAYASTRPRAARYLASIRAQGKKVEKAALKAVCKAHKIDLQEKAGKVHVVNGHMLGFLEVLDRRRLEVKLTDGSPERFRAASRDPV